MLFPKGSVEYNDKNLGIASKHISSLEANLGVRILTPPPHPYLFHEFKFFPIKGHKYIRPPHPSIEEPT